MKKTNLKFSEHALYRKWERGIDDQSLEYIFSHIDCLRFEKEIIIASPSFLQRKIKYAKKDLFLIVITIYNVVKTCFWCHDPEYLYSKESFVHFQNL